jgi:secreted PhoX family phosphatase
MQDDQSITSFVEAHEDEGTNRTANKTIGDVVATRMSRRDLLGGLLGVTAISATVSPLAMLAAADAAASTSSSTPSFNFSELAVGPSERHHVADGYDADILIRWGDPMFADSPPFTPAAQTATAQNRQFGYNCDYLGYIPIDGRSDHGLLCANHEYVSQELMMPGVAAQGRAKFLAGATKEIVDTQMAAHGGSVIEVKRTNGKWAVVPGSKYARRITAETPIRFSGPAAGAARLKTKADPTGTAVKGMLNNCAGGLTPWGTWVTCEENINFYFMGRDGLDAHPDAKGLKRYGIPVGAYAWGHHHDRFDITKEPNEPHRFGWVVEIDPFDPTSTPVKRTALGRFKHEGAAGIVNNDGRYVIYSGDDERFDYVYKFVTEAKVDQQNRAANKDILDRGTLYVARFDADGSGAWLPLVHGQGPLTAANGFNDQADVLIFARLAADALGATKMDRPEDVEANPKTNKVYVMLTNNIRRTSEQKDAANPRGPNKFGHIIEMTPPGGDHAATAFRWDILVRCGDPAIAEVGATFNAATSKFGWFAMPDNCAFDADGRLWVATDGNSPAKTGRNDGVWAMETEGATRGTSKLFFAVPFGAELCGPEFTPDGETFFVAVQHPGERDDEDPNAPPTSYEQPSTRWPDFKPDMPPRPSVVAITKKGGGKIAV